MQTLIIYPGFIVINTSKTPEAALREYALAEREAGRPIPSAYVVVHGRRARYRVHVREDAHGRIVVAIAAVLR